MLLPTGAVGTETLVQVSVTHDMKILGLKEAAEREEPTSFVFSK